MTTFTVTGADLNDAAAWASRVIPPHPAVPVLGGLVLAATDTGLTVSGYDYDTAVAVNIPASTTEPGRMLLSGRLLAGIAAATVKGSRKPVNVTFTIDGTTALVTAGTSEWRLPTLPIDDYPQLPQLGDPVATVNAADLRRAVGRVTTAVGRDDTIPMLTGVKLEGTGDALTLTGTDRFRIATADIDWATTADAELAALTPAALLEHAARAFRSDTDQVAIYHTDGGIGFATDTHRIIGRLLDAEFPRWQQLMIHDPQHHVTVDVAELSRAIDQVLVVVDRVPQVILDFRADLVEVTAGSEDYSKARADAPVLELAGTPMVIGVNPGYLRDALATAGTEQVRIHFGATGLKPMMVTPVGDDRYRHLLMPVRLPQAVAA